MLFPGSLPLWTLLCAGAVLSPARAAGQDASPPESRELRQMFMMQNAPSTAPLTISRLESRYPVWAVRVRDPGSLLSYIGSAALWIDIRTAESAALSAADDLDLDGIINGQDIETALRRKLGKEASIPGAEYELKQLVDIANRYNGKVEGKTVEMPEPERDLVERFIALELVEKSTDGYKARRDACFIFLTNDTHKDFLKHELTHALYSSEPAFRAKVAEIWGDLRAADRELLQKSLEKTYGLQREELLLTEFAAYGIDGFLKPRFNAPPPSRGPLEQASRRLRESWAAFLSSDDNPRQKKAAP